MANVTIVSVEVESVARVTSLPEWDKNVYIYHHVVRSFRSFQSKCYLDRINFHFCLG